MDTLLDARLRQRRAAQSSNQNFILRHQADQQHYSEESRKLSGQQIFRELEAKSILWPDIRDNHITPEQRQLHCLWSNMHMHYWFEKWYRKYRKGGGD